MEEDMSAQVLESLSDRVDRVVRVAAGAAVAVDQENRAPSETIAALKEARLLGMGPNDDGVLYTAAQIAAVARRLGSACSSAGMIWAMHHGQLQGIARSSSHSSEIQGFLDSVWRRQPLIASLMSEVGASSPRESRTTWVESDGKLRAVKHVSVSSYLREADAGLVILRTPSGEPTDPAVILARADEWTIERWKPWQAMGMRGTGSGGGRVTIEVPVGRVLSESFAEMSMRSITPLTHIGWAACWAGIGDSALAVAQRHVRRDQGRLAPDVASARLLRLGHVSDRIDAATAQVNAMATAYDAAWEKGQLSDEITRTSNALRLSVAELAHQAVMDSLQVVGIDAYRTSEASTFSLDRQIRDVISSRVMISEDRIRLASGAFAQMSRRPVGIPDNGVGAASSTGGC